MIILSELSQRHITYMESKKNNKNELTYKTETDSDIENKLMVTKAEGEVKVIVAQLCPALCDPTDCSLPAPLSMEFSRQEYWNE